MKLHQPEICVYPADIDIVDRDVTQVNEVHVYDSKPAAIDELEKLQVLITALTRANIIRVQWHGGSLAKFVANPNDSPMYLVVSSLKVKSFDDSGQDVTASVEKARRTASKTPFKPDWFSDRFTLFSADHLAKNLSCDLYGDDGRLKPQDLLEDLVFKLLSSQIALQVTSAPSFRSIAAITTILFELFENTHLHARRHFSGRDNSLSVRGISFQRISLARSEISRVGGDQKNRTALRIGVFDSGDGFYRTAKKSDSGPVDLQEEWEVLHECLSRHATNSTDVRPSDGPRGFGLYEVLRSMDRISGEIHVRTGRLHGFRTFHGIEGQMFRESELSIRPNMPQALLLDGEKRFVRVPTEMPSVVGSLVQAIVPLEV
jgi:hypothetical protein